MLKHFLDSWNGLSNSETLKIVFKDEVVRNYMKFREIEKLINCIK